LRKFQLMNPLLRFTITTITSVTITMSQRLSRPLMLAFRRMNLKKLKEATTNLLMLEDSTWEEKLLTLLGMSTQLKSEHRP
jgi:hypothetical protein